MNERNILAGITATVLSPFVDGWQNLFVCVIVAFLFWRQRKQIIYNKSYKGEKFNLSLLKLDYL